jgi:hypothetical protein
MPDDKKEQGGQQHILSAEQEVLLELYLKNLDDIFKNIQESEIVQVEIETLHLKRILSK